MEPDMPQVWVVLRLHLGHPEWGESDHAEAVAAFSTEEMARTWLGGQRQRSDYEVVAVPLDDPSA